MGNGARRGDPGSARTLLSLDKPLLRRVFPAWVTVHVAADGWAQPRWLVRLLLRLAQLLEERRQRRQRRQLLE